MSIKVIIEKKAISYKKAMKYIEKKVQNLKKGKNSELIWILEHPLTYTAGVSFDKKDILKKIKLIKTNRGGKITVHNPGQKIIYFAIDLNTRKKDIRNLIKVIENSIIEFLKIYKIEGKADKKNIGIWVKNKKIAAIGIRVSRWVAFHGCSINIKNNLEDYKNINPCGLNNRLVTNLRSETKEDLIDIDKNLKKIFLKNFNKI